MQLKLASGQRSDRPRVAMQVIIEAAAGYAACSVTNAALAERLGIRPEAVVPVLKTLERLALIRCIRDPRNPRGAMDCSAQHFAASDILTEFAGNWRVAAHNRDLNGELGQEQVREAGTSTEDDAEPQILPFEHHLGPLLAKREWERLKFESMAY